MKSSEIKTTNPVAPFKNFTAARIAIGRVGNSIPLKQELEFKLAHAHARDAVYSTLDTDVLTEKLKVYDLPVLHLHSKAVNRAKYLKRPDLGRQLSENAAQQLTGYAGSDLVFVVADGLSATAVNENTIALLEHLMPSLVAAKFKIAPLCMVEQGRVAIGDEIAHRLKAKMVVLLICERPGLSSADSMGCYITYNPEPGITDESRNCISNIRPQGLSHKAAAGKIFYLLNEAFKRKLTGVALKDNDGLLGA